MLHKKSSHLLKTFLVFWFFVEPHILSWNFSQNTKTQVHSDVFTFVLTFNRQMFYEITTEKRTFDELFFDLNLT